MNFEYACIRQHVRAQKAAHGGFELDEGKLTKEQCIGLLRAKADELRTKGENGFPKRADFAEREVVAIKAFFGPWLRALEAAGLKEPRSDDRLQRTKEKRIRSKRRRIEAMKQQKIKERGIEQ